MNHEIKILSKQPLTHNVIQFRFEKPSGYSFNAGQATELSLDRPTPHGPSPFTFTCLNSSPFLELTIKIYEDHKGTTAALAKKKVGETVIITDPWDSFINKGPGVFIAGGAGITPFIAILRQLNVDNKIGSSYLFFSNKTKQDIFLQDELKSLLGNRYVNILTQEPAGERLDTEFFRKHVTNFDQPFYVCGPPGFPDAMQEIITALGGKGEMINVSF